MATLTLNLKSQVRKNQISAAGVEQYNGGEVLETGGNKLVATFMSLSQTVTNVTDAHNLNTAMFDLQIFFVSAQQQHGGHGGGGGHPGRANAPETIRLQGAPDFEGRQPPTVKDEKDIQEVIGSVSAASQAWAHLIGKQFRLMNLNQPGTTAKLEID
jgi:hypothetical protein